MPAATKKSGKTYDPTEEPVNNAAPAAVIEPEQTPEPVTVIEPGKVINIQEPEWMAILRDIAASTPTKYPPTQYVAERIADTGRVLTVEQSTIIQRFTDYVRERNPKIDTRGYGMIPAYRPAHATIFMVDLFAAIFKDLDALSAALSESSGASGAEA